MIKASVLKTTKAIINDLGDELFSILIEESMDISNKEKMIVVLYCVPPIKTITFISLKMSINDCYSKIDLLLQEFEEKVMMVLATCNERCLVLII